MEITSETIKSAISKTLSTQYPEVTLYKNKPKQDMKFPCFFIAQLETDSKKVNINTNKINYLMNVRYHKNDVLRTELDNIGFNLINSLHTLYNDQEAICYGKNARYEIVDNVLQFFINYSVRVVNKKQGIKMQDLSISGGLK